MPHIFQYAIGYESHCYRIITSLKTWTDANNYCNRTYHGTLATVNNRFVVVYYSILFYPITLGGRRGTTDELATIPFHLDLFSAALVELAKSIPVHSLILSSHLFFCLPLFLFPFTVPSRIVFAKPEDLETWPNHLSFRFLTRVRSSSYSPSIQIMLIKLCVNMCYLIKGIDGCVI